MVYKYEFDTADINDDEYSKFGFYSGNNLINAPIKSWFQFLSFPMNNNRNYVLQIGYGVTTGRILHTYVRFKDETHLSWEGVEWKEIDIQYK